jgi:hypothetical protein
MPHCARTRANAFGAVNQDERKDREIPFRFNPLVIFLQEIENRIIGYVDYGPSEW